MQDIELAVAALDEDLPGLSDWDVLNAYEALRRLYHTASTGRKASLRPMSPLAQQVFKRIKTVCERWPGQANEKVTCLQQLRKSLRFWSEKSGRRGYLEFLHRERARNTL